MARCWPAGIADIDFGGNVGLEFLTVPISLVEAVTVEVGVLAGGPSPFTINASFLADSSFSVPPDPDRRPSLARQLTVGQAHIDALDQANGDRWDWFTLTAAEEGSLVFVTRANGPGDPGDIALEVFLNDPRRDASARSDQDLQGVPTNESVTVIVNQGDRVYLKVASLLGGSQTIGYRLSVARLP